MNSIQTESESFSRQDEHLTLVTESMRGIERARTILEGLSVNDKTLKNAMTSTISSLARVAKANAKAAADLNKAAKEEEASE